MSTEQYEARRDVILGEADEVRGWCVASTGTLSIVTSGATTGGEAADVPRLTIKNRAGVALPNYSNVAMQHYDVDPLDQVNFWHVVDYTSANGFVAGGGNFYVAILTVFVQSTIDQEIRKKKVRIRIEVRPEVGT